MPLRGEAARPTYVITDQYRTGPGRSVYLAEHHVFKGPCIQKTVSLVGLADAMFASEPQLIERLDHPHIVSIREAQFDPDDADMVTYVMPFYEGGSAHQHLLDGGRFSVGQALVLGGHLLDALAYLHTEVGFIHRDVKGDNLLLDAALANGFLSDFGSAARIGPTGEVATGGFTLRYMDPAAASGSMTVRSDVFSAGVTIFEMLSGTLVFRFDPKKGTIRLGRGQRPYPDSAFTHAPHVPDPVRRALNKAIHADPRRRYSSAADMATALARADRRVIDWHHATGDGLDGEWRGTWPPTKPRSKRRQYRVTSRLVTTGSRAGQRRLEAAYLNAGAWRGFGALTQYVGGDDHKAVSRFFDTVNASVAQNRAAR